MDKKYLLLAAATLATTAAAGEPGSLRGSRPNLVVVFVDDMGYNDLECFGSPLIKTPNLDKIARNGVRYTDFYVSSSVSSASRAGLMTGQYNSHNGVTGVLWPGDSGLSKEHVTIAEMLKGADYHTACFGKWHLGDVDGSLPTDRGFDYYYGIPYSNDMYIGTHHELAEDIVIREGYTRESILALQKKIVEKGRPRGKDPDKNKVPLFENKKVVEFPCDQGTTTRRYFDHAIDFIDEAGDEPFFTYITPAMPHVPLYASEQFAGTSARGLYGDVVEEIDWNVGRLVKFLKKKGLLEKTLILFTSDNGPWLGFKEKGGCAAPLRDGKFSVYEGGFREPCVAMWKGVIPAGTVSNAIVASIDIFPTFAALAGQNIDCMEIDGIDFSGNLHHPEESHRDSYVYISKGKYRGIRYGGWKYLPFSGTPQPGEPELYNLAEDVSESRNVYAEYPEVVEKLSEKAATLKGSN